MINFEFIESPDLDIIAPFKYFQNQIYIGRTVGDLWVNDKDLFPSHIFLEVIGSDLLIHPQKDVEHYLLNGKRASSIRKLKVNDAITIGKTTWCITPAERRLQSWPLVHRGAGWGHRVQPRSGMPPQP